ncbi:MAG: histidinol-phosphatase HisJ family protein [Oscillospiraceae bacterium]
MNTNNFKIENLIANKHIIDCHTHTHHSMDSELSFEDLLSGARERNVKIITITDHSDLFPTSSKEDIDGAIASLQETEKVSKQTNDILILKGIEIGGLCHNRKIADEILKSSYDFILGSIHNIRNTEDFYFMDFNNKQLDIHEKLNLYFQECLELVLTEKIDSLAHLTYPIRYINGNYKKNINLDCHKNIIDEILNSLIKLEISLEVNTGGVRKPIGEISPEYDILQRYYNFGGKLLTIGSDAHYKEHVGLDELECMIKLKNIGFKELTYYINRKKYFATL